MINLKNKGTEAKSGAAAEQGTVHPALLTAFAEDAAGVDDAAGLPDSTVGAQEQHASKPGRVVIDFGLYEDMDPTVIIQFDGRNPIVRVIKDEGFLVGQLPLIIRRVAVEVEKVRSKKRSERKINDEEYNFSKEAKSEGQEMSDFYKNLSNTVA
jgi:hypothetical protein